MEVELSTIMFFILETYIFNDTVINRASSENLVFGGNLGWNIMPCSPCLYSINDLHFQPGYFKFFSILFL